MVESKEGREKVYTNLSLIAFAVSIMALIISIAALLYKPAGSVSKQAITATLASNSSVKQLQVAFDINSSLITPPIALPSAPVITQQQPFGKRLTNINQPFNASELAVINDAPNAYFEKAGEMLLNGSLTNEVGAPINKVPMFIVNGKPSVIYLGSITCIFCGENRWAMALALSRFGNFTYLFKGYSSFGDGDLPTIYWAPAEYNSSGKDDLGNFYSSKYINFISIDDENPVTGGFNLNPLSEIEANVNASGNLAYKDAIYYILDVLSKNSTTAFQGTPYTIWGMYQVGGADAVDFGNSTPTSGSLPLTDMTHADVLAQLANPNDQFAWTEYAAADLYVAMVCSSINNTAAVCSLPAIKALEGRGY